MLEMGFCEVELRFRGKKIHCQYIFPHAEWVLWTKILIIIIVSLPLVFFFNLDKYLCRYVRACLFIFIYILRICTYTHTSTHVNMYTYIQRDTASRHSKSQEQTPLLFFTAHGYCTAQAGQACSGGSHFPRHSRPHHRSPSCFTTPGSPREPLWVGWVAQCWEMVLLCWRKMKNKPILSQTAVRPHPGIVWFVV